MRRGTSARPSRLAGFRVVELETPAARSPGPESGADDELRSASPVPIGERLAITDARLIRSGWSPADSVGMWTVGFESRLAFHAGDDASPPARLVVEGQNFEPQLNLVYLNGRFLGSLRFDGSTLRRRSVHIPPEFWRGSAVNELVFQTPLVCDAPVATAPSDLGTSPTRGIRVRSLWFEAARW